MSVVREDNGIEMSKGTPHPRIQHVFDTVLRPE